MSKVKKRIQKKHYRIIREALSAGKLVPTFPMFRVREYWDNFLTKRYLTVFRPWWYEQNWGSMDLKTEHNKHFDETMQLFEKATGVNLKLFGKELEKHQRPPRDRKLRKEKPPEPIRKLRNPEMFTIRTVKYVNEERIITMETVEGERVFVVNGYSFFIRHNGRHNWVVSDAVLGAAISFDARYKMAVKRARKRIEENFQGYLEAINKFSDDGTY